MVPRASFLGHLAGILAGCLIMNVPPLTHMLSLETRELTRFFVTFLKIFFRKLRASTGTRANLVESVRRHVLQVGAQANLCKFISSTSPFSGSGRSTGGVRNSSAYYNEYTAGADEREQTDELLRRSRRQYDERATGYGWRN